MNFNPLIDTIPEVILRQRKAAPPSIVSTPEPGPVIVWFCEIVSSALVRIIEPVMENWISSPGVAAAKAALNEPAPLSAFDVTVIISATGTTELDLCVKKLRWRVADNNLKILLARNHFRVRVLYSDNKIVSR